MSDCILGIKCNGVSMKIDTLEIDANQAAYDYICNVMLAVESNGNGRYDISIVDKDFIQGFSIGEWRITKAWIIFNWGFAEAKYIMSDKDGNLTHEIVASRQKGSISGFSTITLAKSIFSSAQKMVCDFPSAPICDSVMALDSMLAVLNPQSIKESYKKYQRKDTYYTRTEDFLDSMGYWAKEISDLVAKYKDVTKDLSDVNDPRAEQLITRTTEDCKNAICSIFE